MSLAHPWPLEPAWAMPSLISGQPFVTSLGSGFGTRQLSGKVPGTCRWEQALWCGVPPGVSCWTYYQFAAKVPSVTHSFWGIVLPKLLEESVPLVRQGMGLPPPFKLLERMCSLFKMIPVELLLWCAKAILVDSPTTGCLCYWEKYMCFHWKYWWLPNFQ